MATKSFGFHHYHIASVYSNKELEPCISVSGNSLCCVFGKKNFVLSNSCVISACLSILSERHRVIFDIETSVEITSKDFSSGVVVVFVSPSKRSLLSISDSFHIVQNSCVFLFP